MSSQHSHKHSVCICQNMCGILPFDVKHISRVRDLIWSNKVFLKVEYCFLKIEIYTDWLYIEYIVLFLK